MDTFAEYLESLMDPHQKQRVEEMLTWVEEEFPNLDKRIAWNQPVFTDHGTYIIGFSTAKKHMAVAPEHEEIGNYRKNIWVSFE